MKNAIVIIIGLLMSLHLNAQKYFTRTGTTQFEASEKVFEPVEATNKSTTAIFNTKTGAVATQVFMAGFQFKNALMQEHFNENYMDSSKYPKATFSGNIQNFSFEELSDYQKEHKIHGVLTIRGIEKEITISCRIKKIKNGLSLKTNFNVFASDFEIKIPKVVRNKISQEINITAEYDLIEKL